MKKYIKLLPLLHLFHQVQYLQVHPEAVGKKISHFINKKL